MKSLLWNCITLIAGVIAILSVFFYIMAMAAAPFFLMYKLFWG